MLELDKKFNSHKYAKENGGKDGKKLIDEEFQ